jgi:hypothetical protein
MSEAQPLYERSLAITERVYGPNHPEVATSLTNVGCLHRELGDHGRGKGMLQRALTIYEQVVGPSHLEVACTVGHLAGCCLVAGDLAQAKTLYERALSIYETQLGRTHPQTATVLKDLANLATIAGCPRQSTPAVRMVRPHGRAPEQEMRTVQDRVVLQRGVPAAGVEGAQEALPWQTSRAQGRAKECSVGVGGQVRDV